jgi:hypothetical protein
VREGKRVREKKKGGRKQIADSRKQKAERRATEREHKKQVRNYKQKQARNVFLVCFIYYKFLP